MIQYVKSPLSIMLVFVLLLLSVSACAPKQVETSPTRVSATSAAPDVTPTRGVVLKEPLITDIYTADPSAHVFEGKLYIYPSHDLGDHPNRPAADNLGSQFDMVDYHVFSMDNMQTAPVDHGEVLNIKDVLWAT